MRKSHSPRDLYGEEQPTIRAKSRIFVCLSIFLISWLFEYESGDQEGGETDEEDPFPGVSGGGGGGGCEHLSCIVPTYM